MDKILDRNSDFFCNLQGPLKTLKGLSRPMRTLSILITLHYLGGPPHYSLQKGLMTERHHHHVKLIWLGWLLHMDEIMDRNLGTFQLGWPTPAPAPYAMRGCSA